MLDSTQPISSLASDGTLLVRGEPFPTLIAGASFVDAVTLLLRGDRPSGMEHAMLDAMFVACCDHGEDPPSTAAARVSASTGNGLHVALAAGLLAMGPKHGCAVSAAMEVLLREDPPEIVVRESMEVGRRIPGFGHKIYIDGDPRAVALLARADALGYHGPYVAHALALERALAVAHGKRLPLNIDGCLAALALELRFAPAVGNALFMIGRLPGIVAHAVVASQLRSYVRGAAIASHAASGRETHVPN